MRFKAITTHLQHKLIKSECEGLTGSKERNQEHVKPEHPFTLTSLFNLFQHECSLNKGATERSYTLSRKGLDVTEVWVSVLIHRRKSKTLN